MLQFITMLFFSGLIVFRNMRFHDGEKEKSPEQSEDKLITNSFYRK